MKFPWSDRGAKTPVETKASKAGALVHWRSALRPAWTPRDSQSLTRAGFMDNVIGFRCVRMIAEASAATPLSVILGDTRYVAHPVMDLIQRPNPTQQGAAFLEAVYGNLLLTGDAYVEAAGEQTNGAPQELYALRSDRMSVAPGRDGWPAAYEYAVGGRKVRFEVGERSPILHLKTFHPQDDHYGMTPLMAAAAAVDVHNAASRWSKALLDNAARPSGAIVYNGPTGAEQLSPDQYDKLMSQLESQHQGARNAGRPMLLEGGLDWKQIGFSPSDMEFLQTKTAAARDIAIAYGVPPMLLGLPGDATYANYQEANRAFYRQTILPLVRKTMTAFADWIGDKLGEAVAIAPDMDQVPALAEEREALWRRVTAADFLSDAEKRRILGLPEKDAP